MSDIFKRLATEASINNVASKLDAICNAITTQNPRTMYGFHINGNESDPSAAVTYIKDAVGMIPAKMDFTNDVFNYGSWKGAFFMPKPCWLGESGIVEEYLDENDYEKNINGNPTVINQAVRTGNAMMEWGTNGKIYYKIEPDVNDSSSAFVYISNYKADDGFNCYSFINNYGVEVDRFYTPIFNGSVISNKLRSLSGQDYNYYCKNKTAEEEIALAQANNPDDNTNIWYTEVMCDITLINLLLILMGKSLDTQSVFGKGNCNKSGVETDMLTTGSMNKKGLFWGEDTGTSGVKVFGMENWWGNQWRRYAGHLLVNGIQKIKMTYSYNTTGVGYTEANSLDGTSGGYINKMNFSKIGLMLPLNVSGSDSTYYCDETWFYNSRVNYAYRGGRCGLEVRCGAFCSSLSNLNSNTYWCLGTCLSCKLKS